MREGHCSEWQSTKGGVVVGGPLQCWEGGVCLQTRPPWFAHETPYLLQKDGERWGLGGLILALVGVVQRLGCCLCTAESRLAPPAWADAEAVRCPKERSRSPHHGGGRGRGGLDGRSLGTRAGRPAAGLASVSRHTGSQL